jgi:UDPglucose 6-dehydrogenase/GDP-mannose 6-dehydrogenase
MVPEFLREGNAVEDSLTPDRIVIGALDPNSSEVLTKLFATPDCPVIATSLRNAEMIKYAANALLATLISFSNEIASLCEKVPGLLEEEVMAGLHLDRRLTSREGKILRKPEVLSYLRGGIGFGGSCFPKDVKALREFAVANGAPHHLLDAVLETNEARPQAIVELLQQAIGSVKGKRIAVAGLAFKENTDDTRESPGVRIVNALCRAGAKVVVHDPLVDGETLRFDGPVEVAKTIENALRLSGACVIATRWPQYIALDWAKLTEGMAQPIVLDGRQVVNQNQRGKPMTYIPIGSKLASI